MEGVRNSDPGLGYGNALYRRVLDELDKRFQMSKRRMSRLHERWRKAEEAFVAYLPERELDAKRRVLREQEGAPQYTTIVLPYTYAMLMSAHSYWTTVFLGREPVFQYMGRHGETEQQVQAAEALVAYQLQVGQIQVPLYFWLLDAGKYGLGVLAQYWASEFKQVTQEVERPVLDMFGYPVGTERARVVQRVPGYQGSRVVNVRPYDYYPDPRVPLWDVQRCEFVGYVTEVTLNELLRGEAAGEYFNIAAVRSWAQQNRAREGGSQIEQLALPGGSPDWDVQTGPYGLLTMYVDLVEKEWGLGKGSYPEKWVFSAVLSGTGAGGDRLTLLVGARPLGCLHQKFPLCVLEMEPEAYAFASRGMPEVLQPLQNVMDWLINSHFTNVRAVLNNQIVVDPSRVVMQDYLEGTAGGAIRLRPAAYGTDVRSALAQLPIADVTRGHFADIAQIHEFAQRAVGVNDQIMGLLNVGGRKTAQEIRTSSTFGVNRQKTVAELYSAMGFGPLGDLILSSSQQYYDQALKLRIVGDLAQEAGPRFVQVDPQAIAGAFDFVPVDGTLPIDRYQQANLWRELLLSMRDVPQILMRYDLGRIFGWVAQLAGLKNLSQFRVQVAPDQAAMQAAMAGNVVPLAAPRGDVSRTLEPGQVSGMGTTG